MTRAVELAQVASNGVSEAFKNRIINGAMTIDQRNAGAAITAGGFPVDRFGIAISTDGAFSAQQDSSAPAGFTNSVKCTTTTADASLSASQYWLFRQRIEGYNVSDLDFGTANAKTVTLSFWVRSSLTGTFGGSIMNSAANRAYPFTYTISVADTWEQKSVTIAGDTTGTWLKTNGNGMVAIWSLGIGSNYQATANAWAAGEYYGTSSSTSVIGTLNATWYITGVQLEVSSTATSFDYRPYGTELQLCQRYYFKYGNLSGGNTYPIMLQCYSSTAAFGKICDLPVQMRTTPTASTSGTFTGSTAAGGGAGAFTSTLVDRPSANFLTTSGWTGSSSLVAGNATVLTMPDSAFVQASAEL
jgi:hypothetical protein